MKGAEPGFPRLLKPNRRRSRSENHPPARWKYAPKSAKLELRRRFDVSRKLQEWPPIAEGKLSLRSGRRNRVRLRKSPCGDGSPMQLRIDLTYNARNQVTKITRYSDLAGNNKVAPNDKPQPPGRLRHMLACKARDAPLSSLWLGRR